MTVHDIPRPVRSFRHRLASLGSSSLHPVAFALLPMVSILSHNQEEIAPAAGLRPVLLCVSLGLATWTLGAVLIRNLARAGLVTSLFLLLFFSFGHVASGFLGGRTLTFFSSLGLVGDRTLLVSVWIGVFLGGSFVVLHRKMPEVRLVQLFNLLALGAMAVPLLTIAKYEWELMRPWPLPEAAVMSIPHTAAGPDARPDIYYIVLDGFGGEEVLVDLYGTDLASFYDKMQRAGFHLVSNARANYSQTGLSLASSLNLTYLDFLAEQLGSDSPSRRPLPRLIRWNQVRGFLEAMGYRVIAFETGSRVTEWPDADVYLSPGRLPKTELDRLLYETSAMRLVPGMFQSILDTQGRSAADAHRERVRFAFDRLGTLATEPGPKFVFAHIIAPHPPFLVARDGSDRPSMYPFTLNDGDVFPGNREEYIEGYRQQVEFVASSIATAVEKILASSPHPPVIIIQGDHGPGSRLTWESPASADGEERMSILNLIYLRGETSPLIYDGMTPVNTFRVVFNEVFGTSLALVPDRSYLSSWSKPYDFYPVP